MATEKNNKLKPLIITLSFGVLVFGIKIFAYIITSSNAILSDALESIVNITAGAFALFSMYYSLKPKDEDHPYGHGKIEFISAGFEGALVLIAGILIIAKATYAFFVPHELTKLDIGLLLTAVSGIANYIMGIYLVKLGKKEDSILMIADGKHLISDTVSSIGLVVGLALIWLTNILWIDNLVAIAFGFFIIYTGFKLLKLAINNLLDEADHNKTDGVIELLNKNRKEDWIDIHNMRILKYGAHIHIDCHVTLPWYYSLERAHEKVTEIENLIIQNSETEVEFFIHSDPCVPPFSCKVCSMQNCAERKEKFSQKVDWNLSTVLPDKKHGL